MAKEKDNKDVEEKSSDETKATEPVKKKSGWRRWITKKRIIVFVIATLLANGVGFLTVELLGSKNNATFGREISLGKFLFEAPSNQKRGVRRAEFNLHISLLSDLDKLGRRLLNTHEKKVQQDIEELLRQASAGDFEDPVLIELKRQLQEKINETLDKRVVSEVIVTGLQLEKGTEPATTVSAQSSTEQKTEIQWKEKEPS